MNTRYRNVAVFVLTGVLLGSSFVAIRTGIEHFPPVLFAAYRFEIAGGILFAYVVATTDWRPRTREDLLATGASGLLVVGLNNSFLNIGVQYTTSAIAAIIYSLTPILTAGLAMALIADEQISRRNLVGLVLGIIGVGIVVQPNPAALSKGDVYGQGLVLLGAIALSLGTVLIQRAKASLSILAVSAWGMLLGGFVAHATSLALGESSADVRVTVIALTSLGFVSVFVSVVAYTWWFDLIGKIGSTRTSLINYLNPIVAAIVGWALLSETITLVTIVGFLVIFTGFVMLEGRALVEELPRPRDVFDSIRIED